jgi:hypothetical protein
MPWVKNRHIPGANVAIGAESMTPMSLRRSQYAVDRASVVTSKSGASSSSEQGLHPKDRQYGSNGITCVRLRESDGANVGLNHRFSMALLPTTLGGVLKLDYLCMPETKK